MAGSGVEHVIKALVDDFPIVLTVRRPQESIPPSNAVVVIAAATGVPAAAYDSFLE